MQRHWSWMRPDVVHRLSWWGFSTSERRFFENSLSVAWESRNLYHGWRCRTCYTLDLAINSGTRAASKPDEVKIDITKLKNDDGSVV